MSDFVPTATVVPAPALMQKQGKPFTAKLFWTELNSSSIPLTHFQAVTLRDALSDALLKHDAETQQIEVPKTLETETGLNYMPIGSVISDKDHDDWTKEGNGEWRGHGGPLLRAKTLVTLWGPFTVVRIPETGLAA